MRKIAIMGAGQSGLHLAIRLVKSGYDVTIISERSAEEIFNGSPTGATYTRVSACSSGKDDALRGS